MSNAQKVSLATIVEDALDNWFERKRKVTGKHDLILYSDERTLIKILKEIDRLTANDWFRVYAGSVSSAADRLLKTRNWFHFTVDLSKELKKGIKRLNKSATKQLNAKAGNRPVFRLGFLAGNIIHQASLKMAGEFEKEIQATKGKIVGKILCITNMKDLFEGSAIDLINSLHNHDQVFVAANGDLYRLRMSDERLYKLIT